MLSDDLADNVRTKITAGLSHARAAQQAAKVRVIPNFVDTEHIRPEPPDNGYRAEYELVGRSVVMYAGNVGLSQSLDLVILAARAFRDTRPEVMFVINGGGAARPELEQQAGDLPNVRFVDMQPLERLPEVLAAADIHVVPLRAGLARSSVPSKMYSILAAGRPIVASVDEGTEVARTVEQAGAGLAVPPDDPEAFIRALAELLDDPARRARMGEAAREFVVDWASPAAVAASYEQLFTELLARRA